MSRYQPRHVFRGGEPISSDALNDNFTELEYAINNGAGARPGNGVTTENLGRRSVPPEALDRPYMVHAWGAAIRNSSFASDGNNYLGFSGTSTTIHLATPDQDVTLIRLAGHVGRIHLANALEAKVRVLVDEKDIGVELNLEGLETTTGMAYHVSAGSRIDVKVINTHDGKFSGGLVWLYARSLPWI